jgi:hypothetical protein
MKPSTILILYSVGLMCFMGGTSWVPALLGLSGLGEFLLGALFGFAYSWDFWPRYFAYVRRSAP